MAASIYCLRVAASRVLWAASLRRMSLGTRRRRPLGKPAEERLSMCRLRVGGQEMLRVLVFARLQDDFQV